mmetsp:Transcript_32817/g.37982  ORF Transcript_32817/g.37982 Transcript_32817/m.37982 type:complete len:323 (-) Transcript_32817:306-1274(-)
MAQNNLFRIFIISIALLIACVIGLATLAISPRSMPSLGVNDIIDANDAVVEKDTENKELGLNGNEVFEGKAKKINMSQPELDSMLRETGIKSRLSQITPNSRLDDTGTAQGMAYNWIVHVDGMKLSGDSTNLFQRYSLAALYFSTGGPDHWLHGEKWMTNVHECSWSYSSFNGHRVGVNSCDSGYNVLTVELANNQLFGSIPPEIGLLTNIRNLDLQNNMLRGSIPPRMGDMKNLVEVFLNDNKLTGSVPVELGQLNYLSQLFLQFNDIEGYVPGDLCLLRGRNNLFNIWTDCLGDDEENLSDVICSCCTYCCNGLDKCEAP